MSNRIMMYKTLSMIKIVNAQCIRWYKLIGKSKRNGICTMNAKVNKCNFCQEKKNLLKKLINFIDYLNKKSNLKYSSFCAENEKNTKIEPKL